MPIMHIIIIMLLCLLCSCYHDHIILLILLCLLRILLSSCYYAYYAYYYDHMIVLILLCLLCILLWSCYYAYYAHVIMIIWFCSYYYAYYAYVIMIIWLCSCYYDHIIVLLLASPTESMHGWKRRERHLRCSHARWRRPLDILVRVSPQPNNPLQNHQLQVGTTLSTCGKHRSDKPIQTTIKRDNAISAEPLHHII